MATASAINPGSTLVGIQGVTTPPLTIDPDAFYRNTRRMTFAMKPKVAIAGLGTTDSFQLRQTGIVSHLEVRVSGTVTFGGTLGTSTMSYEWPLSLVQAFRLSANGQSNLYNARGLMTRALEFSMNPRLDDNGLTGSFGGTAVTTGTLKLPTDDWGTSSSNALNPGTNVPAVGTYTVDLTWVIPVTSDFVNLVGSIYAQTSATNLTLDVQYATQGATAGGSANSGIISALGASATFSQNLNIEVTGIVYSIPNVGGKLVIPDLSVFHQFTDVQFGGQVGGLNEALLPGVGVGRKMLRLFFQEYSGTPPVPLAVNDTNYSTVGWAFGGNDQPESYARGGGLRARVYRTIGVDLGGNWGIGLWDYASQFALRDVVDQGATSDLRVQMGLVNNPTSGFARVAQETLFAAPVGA